MRFGFRWLALVCVAALGLGGCYALVPKAEWTKMQEYKKLYDEMGSKGIEMGKDLASLDRQRRTLMEDKSRLQKDVAEQKRLLAGEREKAAAAAELAGSATKVAETMSKEMAALRAELTREIQQRDGPLGKGVKLLQSGGNIGIRIEGDLLFGSGKATLKESAKALLAKVAKTLQKDKTRLVRVCGFTDSDPIRRSAKKWENNFELSGARALAVLNFLSTQGVAKSRMRFVGFGEYGLLPTGSKPGKENKAKSRRAEIWLVAPAAKAEKG